jgi:hypothetical protein
MKLTRNELRTLFYVGRKLELTACLVPMSQPQARTVKAVRSYGYDMEKADGKVSRLDILTGQTIEADEYSLGFTSVRILEPDGKVAAQYRLL